MITKLIFRDGIEVIHEDSYPSIEPAEDYLAICDIENNIEVEYELRLVKEIIFSYNLLEGEK